VDSEALEFKTYTDGNGVYFKLAEFLGYEREYRWFKAHVRASGATVRKLKNGAKSQITGLEVKYPDGSKFALPVGDYFLWQFIEDRNIITGLDAASARAAKRNSTEVKEQ